MTLDRDGGDPLINPEGYGPRMLDENTPNSARMYDYVLGGAHNFAVDRELADKILAKAPTTGEGARLNRAFMRRAVRFLAERGIDQFLDLGSGVPTAGNVHEIAQDTNPDARVVYVDYEPVAYHAAQELLAGNPNATIIQVDLRDPDVVLNHPQAQALLDFSRPIGLLMIGVLYLLSDDDHPADLVARYRDALPPGSYLALSQTSLDESPPDVRAEVEVLQAGFRQATEGMYMRSKQEITAWFTGTELVEPGIVSWVDWRPDEPITPLQRRASYGYAGIGRISS